MSDLSLLFVGCDCSWAVCFKILPKGPSLDPVSGELDSSPDRFRSYSTIREKNSVGVPFFPPEPGVFDAALLNKLFKPAMGYEPFGYMEFFITPEAPKIISEHVRQKLIVHRAFASSLRKRLIFLP